MNNAEQEWDIIITSKKSWFDLQLNQIWSYRDLLMLFVKRDIISFYKQTVFGPLWYFIQPVFTTIVFNCFNVNCALADAFKSSNPCLLKDFEIVSKN